MTQDSAAVWEKVNVRVGELRTVDGMLPIDQVTAAIDKLLAG